MTILLLGAHGQLGNELGGVLPGGTLLWGKDELNLSRIKSIAPKIKEVAPDVVINAAAMTDVDLCETKRDLATEVNEDAPGALAKVCKEIDAVFVHVSTDYVFGADTDRSLPYLESDRPSPVNHYGHTKSRGEQHIARAGGEFLIVRTCGLYGGKSMRPTYADQVIEKVRRGESLRATIDQIYSPTNVNELASAIWRCIQEARRGILHIVNTQPVSRLNFTRAAVELLGAEVHIDPATQGDFSSLAPRPTYSALDSERIDLKEYMSDWRTALARYIQRLAVW